MKRIILLLVTVALSSIYVWGQSTPPAGMFYMQFTVAPSSSFKFKLQGHLKNTDVWVSTSPANYTHQTISDVWSDYQTVNAGPKLPTTVRIFGAIKAIDAGLKTTNENNELALIDVTKNPSLIALSCYSAGVRTLKISENSELTTLECSNNLLTNLDVSQNSNLERLNCANNELILLNVANGSNSKLSSFNASGNSGLTCIQVDDGFTPPANWLKDATAEWNNDITNPCPNNFQISFRTTKAIDETISLRIDAAIEDQADVWIDLNNNGAKDDGEAITAFSTSESTEYTLGANKVTLYGKINYFVCSSNALSSLDVSKNNNLTTLFCANNQLSSLDVSQNTKLSSLNSSSNQLSNIDVSKNTNLRTFYCASNQLSSLDISKNTNLSRFQCQENQLSILDVSKNTEISLLYCYSNQLSSLDLSQNANLSWFYCNDNQLKTLDVSDKTKLIKLNCHNNQLTGLNVANGNNTNFTTFNATNNPNLTCIQVDDGFTPSAIWLKDATAEWNNDSTNPCPNNFQITFTTTKAVGETIKLGVNAASADQSNIWIDLNNNGVKDDGEAVTSFTNSEIETVEYVLGAQNITLYGKVNFFNCFVHNKLDNLDVSQNTNLTKLFCANNQLSNLDISKNINLDTLNCSNNQLSTLDVSQNTSIKYLDCSYNTLNNLDISQNVNLTTLYCQNNKLTNLDVNQNTNLTKLYCNDNQLKSLFLDQNTKLTTLDCKNNQLTSLNVANGNNTNFIIFNATNNPNLTCIQVDDGFTPPSPWLKDATAEWNNDSENPCFTSPQMNFITTKAIGETIMLAINAAVEDQADVWIDLNNNGTKDSGEEVVNFSNLKTTDYVIGAQQIVIYGKVTALRCNSTDLTYLKVRQNLALTFLLCQSNQLSDLDVSRNSNLTTLNCGSNQLSSLDVSQNVDLSSLSCHANKLNSLDLSQNVNLSSLSCYSNKLNSLDVSTNIKLSRLECSYNQIDDLNLSQNVGLTNFDCRGNNLSQLDVSKNTDLTSISLYNNQLSNLDLSKNTLLTSIDCSYNQLSSLDIKNNVQVTSLSCSGNTLTTLDLSKNTNLESLTCQNNKLASLNVANGNNTNVTTFNATNNPDLTCIQVDDGFTPPDTWLKDAAAEWNNDSDNPCPNNLQINFTTTKAVGETISLGINAASEDQADIWIDLNSNGIKDEGEAITSFSDTQSSAYTIGAQTITIYGKVNKFNCNSNQLNSLDISQNTKLESLTCSSNLLNNLNVSQSTNLTYLDCGDNPLSTLDVSQNVSLTSLTCSANQLSSLDVKENVILETLNCNDNPLSTLDVSQNVSLKSLSCSANQLSSLDVKENVNLETLNCNDNSLSTLDISQNVRLTSLTCIANQLSSLDVKENVILETLNCNDNSLSTLDVSQNVSLTSLTCSANQLSSLDVNKNTQLTTIDCAYNQLTSLSVANGNNANVTTFNATNNPDLTCIQVDDGFTPPETWLKDAFAEWNNDSDNPCGSTVGVNDLVLNTVQIFPNPAKEFLYITSDVKVQWVKLYNMEGKLVIEQDYSNAIPLRHLPNGIYQVMIITNKGVYTKKLIKQ